MHNQTFFMTREGRYVELEHFDKDFIKITRKRGPTVKKLGVFSSRYFENYILNGKFKPKMDTIRAFLSKIRTLFYDFQKEQESPPSLP